MRVYDTLLTLLHALVLCVHGKTDAVADVVTDVQVHGTCLGLEVLSIIASQNSTLLTQYVIASCSHDCVHTLHMGPPQCRRCAAHP